MRTHNSRLQQSIAALVIPAMGVLALSATGFAFGACTAAHSSASIPESTPTSAFIDNGDGTVTHKLTGLMWKRCAQGLSGAACTTGTATTLTWGGAGVAAVADRTGGRSDWRVPSKLELESIVEYCGWGPSINQTMFPATPSQIFLTGSSAPFGTSTSGINFTDGVPFNLTRTFPFQVRLVRGGRTFDAFDATPPPVTVTKAGSGSGTVSSTPAGISCGSSPLQTSIT